MKFVDLEEWSWESNEARRDNLIHYLIPLQRVHNANWEVVSAEIGKGRDQITSGNI